MQTILSIITIVIITVLSNPTFAGPGGVGLSCWYSGGDAKRAYRYGKYEQLPGMNHCWMLESGKKVYLGEINREKFHDAAAVCEKWVCFGITPSVDEEISFEEDYYSEDIYYEEEDIYSSDSEPISSIDTSYDY